VTDRLAVEVALTIPDNAAETARATLARLGVPLGGLERAELYRFELEAYAEEALLVSLRSLETIYNPNKHVLRVRTQPVPQPGEVWVDELHPAGVPAHSGPVRIAGRTLAGVRSVEPFVVWRMLDAQERPASAAVVRLAAETLLCNSAFQRAHRA
jgi:hypothetical protein